MSYQPDKNVIMKQQATMAAKFMARRQQNNNMDSRALRKFEQNHQPHEDHRNSL